MNLMRAITAGLAMLAAAGAAWAHPRPRQGFPPGR